MNPLMIKDLTELGVMVVICWIFINQQQKMFGYFKDMISITAKLEKQLNNDYLKGKGLEIALILKIQEMRWSIQNRVILYIKNNHLKENWSIINKEIDTFFDRKIIDFETNMHDIIENVAYVTILKLIKKELEETKVLLLQVLDDLKNDGVDEQMLYEKAIRIVEDHMLTVENELILEIKAYLN